jgi:hypothetical protein
MGRPKKIVPSEVQEPVAEPQETTIEAVEPVAEEPTEATTEEKKEETIKTVVESNAKFTLYLLKTGKNTIYEIRNSMGQLIGREVDHYTALKTFNRFSR